MSEHTIIAQQKAAGAELMSFGPAEAGLEIVESFGSWEAEYAMIRKGVGLLHLPWRAVLRFTGAERADFLHRMMTQDINALAGGSTVRGFQLNEKGRILADAVIHHGDCDTWLEMDCFDLPGVHTLLDSRLFSEDVTIEDWTTQRTALALLGPLALPLLETLAQTAEWASTPARMFEMPGTHHVLNLQGAAVSAYRWDDCGSPGVRLLVPSEQVEALYASLAQQLGGLRPEIDQSQGEPAGGGPKRTLRGRGIGWSAYNTARIEAGAPLFHVDFGPDCLPHETGLLQQTVSFKKGCYLGQEIVARMEHLGHPKRMLAGIRLTDARLPIAGSQVFDGEDTGKVIGGITSSTNAPMLGGNAIALAMMKWGKHRPGAAVKVAAEGALVDAQVAPLRALPE